MQNITNQNMPNKILSIRISTDGFYFSTQSYTVRKEFLHERSYARLKMEFENFLRHQTDFDVLEVAFESSKFSFFPNAYANAEPDFRKLFDVADNECVMRQYVEGTDMFMLYTADADLCEYFRTKSERVSFCHTLTPLLLQLPEDGAARRLYLDVYSRRVYALVAENSGLLFANSFLCDSDEQFLYAIADIFTQFSLNQQETAVFYTDFDRAKAKKALLQKYIKNVVERG
ncbi:MAG: DUF3822 family protein [Bacteroidales bacterium]|nr:DUF3822 family protein [Bacteroidales bacterium]